MDDSRTRDPASARVTTVTLLALEDQHPYGARCQPLSHSPLEEPSARRALTLVDRTTRASLGGLGVDACFAMAERERRGAPAGDPFAQSRSPALADIIGARRVRTVAMISSGSIPCR